MQKKQILGWQTLLPYKEMKTPSSPTKIRKQVTLVTLWMNSWVNITLYLGIQIQTAHLRYLIENITSMVIGFKPIYPGSENIL